MRVGLTGGIGAGKSTVARLLARHGAVVVDYDRLAREAVAPGTPGAAAVLEAFGTLDRERLAAVVFSDPVARARLNAIVHPLVAAAAAEAEGDVVVHDVPLLVEAGLTGDFDAVVVVEAPLEVRLRRIGRPDAAARIAAQATDAERRAVATHVIDNGGDLADLERHVADVWQHLTAINP